jgi:peroxiredoxin
MNRAQAGIGVGALVAVLLAGAARAQSPAVDETYWQLLHEDAVRDDLKLTAAQQAVFHAALDPLDLELFPLRNRSRQEAGEGLTKIVAEARQGLAKVLKPQQAARLDKLVQRQLGMRALQEEGFAKQLALSEKQRTAVEQAIVDAQAALAKLRDEQSGKSPEELNKESADISRRERDAVLAELTDAQKRKWASLIAGDFDVSRLGSTRFKVPELVGDAAAWRNSPPLRLADQKGKVVIVHFFACGCINCIHNYPIYRQWHDEFAGKDVVLMGIHTPETKTERDLSHLERKLKEDTLAFPVLIDNDGANWNAWGNSMWPSVYVIDKQGYLRHFWAGELKWQGAKGDEIASDWIERLRAEK